jgi:hypothetical protein
MYVLYLGRTVTNQNYVPGKIKNRYALCSDTLNLCSFFRTRNQVSFVLFTKYFIGGGEGGHDRHVDMRNICKFLFWKKKKKKKKKNPLGRHGLRCWANIKIWGFEIERNFFSRKSSHVFS